MARTPVSAQLALENEPRANVAVDFANVQGIVRYGYGRCNSARFCLIRIDEPSLAKRWLANLVGGEHANGIRDARRSPSLGEECLNLALTYQGLRVLGVDPQALAQFSREFQEGMSGSEHRSRILGDHGTSAPSGWRWGGPKNPVFHLLLMLYANRSTIAAFHQRIAAEVRAHGMSEIVALPPTVSLPGFKEHFGFTDGIGQPQLDGFEEEPEGEHWEGNRIRLGEVLLGHENEYGQITERPLIGAEADDRRILPADASGSGKRDLGRDGTYLVIRQLRQDVGALWRFVDAATGGNGREQPDAMIALASKMVGRWPNGTSLVAGDRPSDQDAFDYDGDPVGRECPLGAHVRRANPRGSILPQHGGARTKDRSLKVSRLHRIVRRGRAFGAPVDPSMLPEKLLAGGDDGTERGLYFVCLNANISRQFEFLQQAWLNNPKFQGGYDEQDPLLGDRATMRDLMRGPGGTFTVPASPVSRCYRGAPRFVDVRGGAYFFLPSLAALRFVAGDS